MTTATIKDGTITIRAMEFPDIPGVVDVLSRAFYNDEFYSILNPYRGERPLAWRYWCEQRLRRRFVQKDSWGFIALIRDAGGEEKIAGYTIWTYGAECTGGTALDVDGKPKADVADPPVAHNNTSVWFSLERFRCQMEGLYNEHPLSPYHIQCADKVPLASLLPRWLQPAKAGTGAGSSPAAANAEFIKAAPAPPFAPLPVHWHCSGLGVSPDQQGKGIGKALMRYALEKLVKPHNVPATLIASPDGFPVYKSIGFKTVGWLSPPGLFKGGMAMIWDEGLSKKCVRPANGADVWGREVDVVYIDEKNKDKLEMEVPETKEELVELMVEAAV